MTENRQPGQSGIDGQEPEPYDHRSEVLRLELERRIELIENADDDDFGSFTALDWTICTLFFLALPLLIAWWAR